MTLSPCARPGKRQISDPALADAAGGTAPEQES